MLLIVIKFSNIWEQWTVCNYNCKTYSLIITWIRKQILFFKSVHLLGSLFFSIVFFFFLTTSSMYVVYSGHPPPSILSPPHTTSSPFLPPSISTTLSISVLFLLLLCDPMNFIRAPLTGMSAKLFSGTFVHHWWLHHCRQGLLSSRNPLLSLVPLAVWGPIGSSAIYDWKLIGPLLCKPYANDQNNSEIKSVMTISWP